MVQSRRYISIIETQTVPVTVGDKTLVEGHPLRYVAGIMNETEEAAWHSYDKVEGAKVVQVVPIDIIWNNEGQQFCDFQGDKLIEEG